MLNYAGGKGIRAEDNHNLPIHISIRDLCHLSQEIQMNKMGCLQVKIVMEKTTTGENTQMK